MPRNQDVIWNKTGAGISLSAIVTCLVFGVFGIFVSIDWPFIGIPVSIAFFGAAGNRTGIIIDLKNEKYFRYSTFWFKRFGKWKSLKAYQYLSLQTNVEGSKLQIGMMPMGPSVFETYYDVILVSRNMRRTILVSRHNSKESAKVRLKELIEAVGKSYVSMNPKKNPILKARISNRR